jgi:nucleoid-associated protein YgaU
MTQPGLPAERTSLARPLILGFLALGSLAAAGVFALRLFHQPRPDIASLPTAPAATPVPPPSARSVPSPAAGPIPPTFDIVRIVPGGGAVIAGHAAPGAEIAIMADGKELGRVQADASGSWVFVPSAQLPTGGREFTLSERLPDTGEIVAGAGSVVAVVPDAAGNPALAVLAQPGGAPRVLQAPGAPGGTAGKLALSAADYDDRGVPRFAGTAPADTAVRVYVDGRPVGDARADAQGNWTLSPGATLAPGHHTLRVDQLDRSGAVTARIEVPLQREQLAAGQLGGRSVVVAPGESLWRLARRSYGSGLRYTVIYQANQTQIRDPDKIYPGQAFTVPDIAATPAPR